MTERSIRRVYFGLAVAGTLAAVVILLASHGPLALGDYAEWTYHGVLLRDTLQGHPDAAYLLKRYPVPNSLTTVALGLLMLVFSWQTAAKIWLTTQALFGFLSACVLNRAAGKQQGWQLIVLSSAVLFGGAFWFGFINFLIGVSFAMLLCAELLRATPRGWLLGTLFVLTFFSHMVPFAFAMLAFLLYIHQNRQTRLLVYSIPGLLLSAWYLIGRFTYGNVDGQAGMIASVVYMTPAFAVFKAGTFLKSWGFVNPSAGGRDSLLLAAVGPGFFLLLLGLELLVSAGVLVLLVQSALRAYRSRAANLFLWQAILAFSFISLLLPGTAAGISDPGGRMMQVAMWCGLLLVGARWRWSRAALAACSVALLSVDLLLLSTVAQRGPVSGQDVSPFRAEIRQFGHVLFAGRWTYYESIERHRMHRTIYPTALFVEAPAKPSASAPAP